MERAKTRVHFFVYRRSGYRGICVFRQTKCPMELVAKVDNTQAITAVTKSYSKNVKFLERTHRCSIGIVHGLVESNQLVVEYCPTLAHRGDGFTKCLNPVNFIAARDMMSMIQKKTISSFAKVLFDH